MSKAIFVTFGADEYMKSDTRYKTLFPFWLKYIAKAKDYFDQLFIIDSDWGFTINDLDLLDQQIGKGKYLIEVYHSYRKHWENLNYAKEIHYDQILFLDNDTIIYDPAVLTYGFWFLETNPGAIGILDSSGKFNLGVQTILDENKVRGERFRLAPYFSFINKSALDKTDKDFTPKRFNAGFSVLELKYETKEDDFTDSMGWITLQLLANNVPIFERADDRRSLYIEEDGTIKAEEFLDSKLPSFDTGYYHIRNFYGGFNVMNAKLTRPDDYAQMKTGITRKEVLRLLAWFSIVCPEADSDIMGVVSDYGVPIPLWVEYLSKFKEFHKWL